MSGPLACHIRSGVVAASGPSLPAVFTYSRQEHPAGICPHLPINWLRGDAQKFETISFRFCNGPVRGGVA